MFLPIELIDYILSFLQSDTYCLEECTRGDPVLSKIAERYIYAHIALFDDTHRTKHLQFEHMWKARTTHQLTETLANKPEIARYIHSLTIYLKDYGNSPLITLSSLLPMFSDLTSVTIKGNQEDSSWDELPEKFRQTFPVFLRAQLKELRISYISCFPLSLLDGCRNLEAVTLDLCEKIQYDKGFKMDRGSPLLKHFAIRPARGMRMEHITSWLQTHNFCSLKVTCAPEDLTGSLQEHLPPLLFACSHSLTNLCLVLKTNKNGPDIFHFPVNLARVPHLEHLMIYAAEDSISALPSIVKLMSMVAPSLKKLSLDMEFYCCEERALVPLVALCSSLSVTVHVFIRRWFSGTFPLAIRCDDLKPYIKRGLFIAELLLRF